VRILARPVVRGVLAVPLLAFAASCGAVPVAGPEAQDRARATVAGSVSGGGIAVSDCGTTACGYPKQARARPRVGPQRGVLCPPGAVRLRPDRNIRAVIEARPEGTTFCFERGTYRLTSALVPKSHDVFVGEYGAVLKGSKVVKDWRRDGKYWVAKGQTQEGEVVSGAPCRAGFDCNRPEGVFIGLRSLVHVTSLSEVRRGRFYFDYAKDKIFIADDPRGRRVEASVAPAAFLSTNRYAEDVTIKNLVIEMFADPSRSGAIYDTISPGWSIVNNEVAFNHAVGIAHYSRTRIVGNDIHDNGQLGLSGYGTDGVLVSRNEIAWNAFGGFTGWEAGGTKYFQTTDLTVRGNYVHDNRYAGLWTDTDNRGTIYKNNTITHNRGSGIFHEVSFDCTIQGNRIVRNGADGIFISSSSNVEASGNVIKGNRTGGVHLFLDEGSGYGLADNLIRDNVISMPAGTITGLTTVNPSDLDPYSANNRFRRNSYVVPDLRGGYWAWQGGLLTWKEWHAAGQDIDGSRRRA
jgi:parallel beta-helix repeat protein